MSRKVKIVAEFDEYDHESMLADEDRELLEAAREVAKEAYAPYSQFFVGAAVLLENGEIIKGSNQENIAYNSGICAERVAIFAAGANFAGVPVKAIAVTARSENVKLDEPLSPCGACRQVIAEYETRYMNNIRILMAGETGPIHVTSSIKALLPLMFQSDGVKKHF